MDSSGGTGKAERRPLVPVQVGGAENGQDSGLIPFGRTDVQTLDEEAMSHTLFDEGSALTGQTGDAASLMIPGPSGGSQGTFQIFPLSATCLSELLAPECDAFPTTLTRRQRDSISSSSRGLRLLMIIDAGTENCEEILMKKNLPGFHYFPTNC